MPADFNAKSQTLRWSVAVVAVAVGAFCLLQLTLLEERIPTLRLWLAYLLLFALSYAWLRRQLPSTSRYADAVRLLFRLFFCAAILAVLLQTCRSSTVRPLDVFWRNFENSIFDITNLAGAGETGGLMGYWYWISFDSHKEIRLKERTDFVECSWQCPLQLLSGLAVMKDPKCYAHVRESSGGHSTRCFFRDNGGTAHVYYVHAGEGQSRRRDTP